MTPFSWTPREIQKVLWPNIFFQSWRPTGKAHNVVDRSRLQLA